MSDAGDQLRGPELRQRAEQREHEDARRASRIEDPSLPEEINRLLHELRVHQIELEMQNEELRDAQERLQASQVRYFGLYDLAPVGYLTLSAEGLILEANLTAATLFGVDRETLVRSPFSRIVFRDDQDVYYKHRLACKASRSEGSEAWTLPRSCELRISRSDGSVCWVDLETTLANDLDDTPVCRMTVIDITARKLTSDQLVGALHEKDLLLKEIHHRVKNNLQVVCSLLNIQSGLTRDPEAKMAFLASVDRVRSMAYAHENVYRAGDLANIDFEAHVRMLTSTLMRNYAPGSGIQCVIDAGGITLGIDVAIPCGLIINELVTNAIKHAFPQRSSGLILVAAHAIDGGRLRLTVRDDGVGIPDILIGGEAQTMGMNIVSLLANQLEGTVSVQRDGGTAFIIEFPVTKP